MSPEVQVCSLICVVVIHNTIVVWALTCKLLTLHVSCVCVYYACVTTFTHVGGYKEGDQCWVPLPITIFSAS